MLVIFLNDASITALSSAEIWYDHPVAVVGAATLTVRDLVTKMQATQQASRQRERDQLELERQLKIQQLEAQHQQLEADKHLKLQQLEAQRQREREQLELECQQRDADRQARQQEQLLDELRRRELETREQAERSAAEACAHAERLAALEEYQLQTVQTQPPVVNNYSHRSMSPSQNTLVPAANSDMTSQCETATTYGYTEPPIAVLVDTSEPATQLNSSTTNTVVASPLHQSTAPPCTTYLSATILQPASVTTSHVPPHMQVAADVQTHNNSQLAESSSYTGGRQTLSLQRLQLL